MRNGEGGIVTAIELDAKYVNVLESLGNPQDGLAEAVRRYATERIAARIAQLHREISHLIFAQNQRDSIR